MKLRQLAEAREVVTVDDFNIFHGDPKYNMEHEDNPPLTIQNSRYADNPVIGGMLFRFMHMTSFRRSAAFPEKFIELREGFERFASGSYYGDARKRDNPNVCVEAILLTPADVDDVPTVAFLRGLFRRYLEIEQG